MGDERDPRAEGPFLGTNLERLVHALAGRGPRSLDPEYNAWLALRTPGPRELAAQARAADGLPWRPFVDVFVRRRPDDDAAVVRTRASLRAQTYQRFAFREAPGGEAEARLARGIGDLVIAMDAGDALAPHALFAIAATGDAGAELFYFDEDRLAGSLREAPWFKPGWSPEELESHDYTAAARAFRRDLLVRAGVRDLAAALPSLRRVRHVPDVLLHRREDASLPRERLAPAPRLARRVRVAAIVPTKDGADLLDACVRSLDAHPNRAELELVIVDNGSTRADARALLSRLRERPGCRVLSWPAAFNWSAVNNFAARRTSSEFLLFMNNDVEATRAGWLDAMLALASRPEIGLVGAQLVYPDDTIQHGGVVVGMTGFAGHLFQGCLASARTRFGPTHVTRNCSSVTGACMLVRREVFQRLGGFDERFVLCGSDVALGLRAMSLGLRNAVTPEARLVHHESRTRGAEVPASDYRVSLEVYGPWLRAGDPYYNPNLSLRDGTCRLRLAREDMLARARWIAR
ncbi:MAG TPA: glycosyltransferase family 2 protein [Myxococcota bacterium]|nr:glycosyltransferase family 2 protein [Myxococcota bacterium]